MSSMEQTCKPAYLKDTESSYRVVMEIGILHLPSLRESLITFSVFSTLYHQIRYLSFGSRPY